MLTQVVVKLNRACNLRCTYCYYINDSTPEMGLRLPLGTLELFLSKYAAYCERSQLKGHIAFHGGEPLLMGKRYFRQALEHHGFKSGTLRAAVQTNGLKLDEEWIRLFDDNSVSIGLSLDGPPHINDRWRILTNGSGSYQSIVAAIRRMQQMNVHVYVLCVIDPAASGKEVFEHLVALGVRDMDFLPPISNHAAQRQGGVDLAGVQRFLTDAFAAWAARADSTIRVRLFCEMMWRFLGIRNGYTPTGVDDWTNVGVLEADGLFCRSEELQGLSVFDGRERYTTTTSVASSSIEEAAEALQLADADVDWPRLPTKCTSCEMNNVCNGGSLASRFDECGSFNNPGIHCNSLYALSAMVKQICATASVAQ